MSTNTANPNNGYSPGCCALCRVWTNRPSWPCKPTRVHPLQYAGVSTSDKLANLRKAIKEAKCDALVLNDLAEIAWAFNMRGADVDCNPVFVAYAVVGLESTELYLHGEQVTEEVAAHLKEAGVTVREYDEVRPLQQGTLLVTFA